MNSKIYQSFMYGKLKKNCIIFGLLSKHLKNIAYLSVELSWFSTMIFNSFFDICSWYFRHPLDDIDKAISGGKAQNYNSAYEIWLISAMNNIVKYNLVE